MTQPICSVFANDVSVICWGVASPIDEFVSPLIHWIQDCIILVWWLSGLPSTTQHPWARNLWYLDKINIIRGALQKHKITTHNNSCGDKIYNFKFLQCQFCILLRYQMKLNESTAHRHLKSPRSLSGRSLHLTLVTKRSWLLSWMTNSYPLCSMPIRPPIPKIQLFQNLTTKIHGRGHVCGQKWRLHLTSKIQGQGKG